MFCPAAIGLLTERLLRPRDNQKETQSFFCSSASGTKPRVRAVPLSSRRQSTELPVGLEHLCFASLGSPDSPRSPLWNHRIGLRHLRDWRNIIRPSPASTITYRVAVTGGIARLRPPVAVIFCLQELLFFLDLLAQLPSYLVKNNSFLCPLSGVLGQFSLRASCGIGIVPNRVAEATVASGSLRVVLLPSFHPPAVLPFVSLENYTLRGLW